MSRFTLPDIDIDFSSPEEKEAYEEKITYHIFEWKQVKYLIKFMPLVNRWRWNQETWLTSRPMRDQFDLNDQLDAALKAYGPSGYAGMKVLDYLRRTLPE